MDPKLRGTLVLSPIALAAVLALASVGSVAQVPWLSPSVAEANHCTPPCDCYTACVCYTPCDCNWCAYVAPPVPGGRLP